MHCEKIETLTIISRSSTIMNGLYCETFVCYIYVCLCVSIYHGKRIFVVK